MVNTYHCRQCGGEISFNPNLQKLECPYCTKTYDVSEYETVSETQDYSSTLNQTGSDSNNDDYAVYICSQCGAEVIASKTTIATKCEL